jgi:hypothetical protein
MRALEDRGHLARLGVEEHEARHGGAHVGGIALAAMVGVEAVEAARDGPRGPASVGGEVLEREALEAHHVVNGEGGAGVLGGGARPEDGGDDQEGRGHAEREGGARPDHAARSMKSPGRGATGERCRRAAGHRGGDP